MEASTNNFINILDLPNEILLTIIKKLNMVDVLYSLVDINERLNQLVFDPFYIHNLDMTMKSSSDDTSSISDQVLNRICKNILPRIHHHVNKLTVEPHSLKHILFNGNIYPQLFSLSFINFQEEMLYQYLTGILFKFVHFNQ
ncbi:unnamed protein product [Rotaria sp. Silwood1]|nr:unnamed protein product [Rotaria sp. Silwood1]